MVDRYITYLSYIVIHTTRLRVITHFVKSKTKLRNHKVKKNRGYYPKRRDAVFNKHDNKGITQLDSEQARKLLIKLFFQVLLFTLRYINSINIDFLNMDKGIHSNVV